jgi:uncharacterized protein (DUF1800 family)
MQIQELRAWWLEWMRATPRPLQEKLTFFWHDHFATGFRKVRLAHAMYLQNETFRRHAIGSWEEMLLAVSRDPAMLVYLDGARSNRRAPNENYARELLELFTLGEGRYSEEDIREAARAFTGWSLDRRTQQFVDRPRLHDDGIKTFLGERGAFDGTDIIRMLLKHEAAAPFICRKLWEYFAYPDPEPERVAALAGLFRAAGFQFRPVLHAMFRSAAFYSARAVRTQIKSPVQWLVSSVRYLEAPLPPAGISLSMLQALGQELFDPPNVAGWEGGYAWISTAALFHRYNFAAVLTEGGDRMREALGAGAERAAAQMRMGAGMEDMQGLRPVERRRRMQEQRQALSRPVMDPAAVLPAGQRADARAATEYLQWRLFQSPLREEDRAAFREQMAAFGDPAGWTDAGIRGVVHKMMSTPQFQLT